MTRREAQAGYSADAANANRMRPNGISGVEIVCLTSEKKSRRASRPGDALRRLRSGYAKTEPPALAPEGVYSGISGLVRLNSVSKTLDLMGLASGRERRELTAAHHSEKSDDLTAPQNGPVKGMSSRHLASGAGIGWIDGASDERCEIVGLMRAEN